MKKFKLIIEILGEAIAKFFNVLKIYREKYIEFLFKNLFNLISFLKDNKFFVVLNLIQVFFIILVLILVFLTEISYIKFGLLMLVVVLLVFLRKSASLLKLKKINGGNLDEKEFIFRQLYYTGLFVIIANISVFVFFWLGYYLANENDIFGIEYYIKNLYYYLN